MDNLRGMSDSTANNGFNAAGAATSDPTDEAIRQMVRKAINASPLLEGILDDWQSCAHWGINE